MKRPFLLVALLVVSGLVAIACSDSKNTIATKTYSGRLIQVIQDNINTKPTTRWQLQTSTKLYWVLWGRPLYIPPPDTEVTLTGQLEKETIRNAKALVSVPRRTALRTLKEGEELKGPTNLAWILYTWKGTPAPWTAQEFKEYGVGDNGQAISVKKFYENMSFGKVKVTAGDVYGPYTLNIPEGCITPQAQELAILKAAEQGWSEGPYSNTQFVYPQLKSPQAPCGSSANSPGRKSFVAIGNTGNDGLSSPIYPSGPSGAEGVKTMAHEIAHNFQAQHAGTRLCTSGTTGVTYTNAETGCEEPTSFYSTYGNEYDTEGGSGTGKSNNFNARLKWQMGWWTSSQIKEVTETGNYTIEPDETNEAGTHLLAIPRPAQTPCKPPTSTFCTEYYYVEFHQPIKPWSDYTEIEAAHPTRGASLYEGAWVQLSGAPETTNNKHETKLLHMNPLFAFCCGAEIEDEWNTKSVALKAGQTYEDTSSPHIKIKTESVSSAGVVVKVTIPPGGEVPKGVNAVGVSASQVAVTWNAVANATSYKLYRLPGETLIAGDIEEGPRWLDSGLVANKSYEYCVKAVTSEGTTECSAAATGITRATESEKGGIVGWVDTGKEKGLAEKTPLGLAKVQVFKGAELKGEATTLANGFWFVKELAAPENTQYTVKITKSGYFANTRTTVVIPNHAQLHIVNLGVSGVGGEILWEGGGVKEAAYKQWSELDYWPTGGPSCLIAAPTAGNTENANAHLEFLTTGFAATSAVGKAWRFRTYGSDGQCYEHTRSELANFNTRGFKPGDEAWFAWEVSPGAGLGASPGILPQWHAKGGCGNPPVSVGTNNSSTTIEVSTRKVPSSICETGNTITKLTAKMKAGEWTKIVARIKFAETETGEVEVFVNGVKEFLKTSERTVGEGEVKTRIGLYTDEAAEAYFAGFTAATTREKAEENAF